MKGKGFMVVSISLLVSIFLIACGKGANNENEILIGAVLPLTGYNSAFGQSSKAALDMLVDETNKKGGILGKPVKIIYKDDQSEPINAAYAVQKLIHHDGVVGIVGSATSKSSIAMGPIATQNKIPMVVTTATCSTVTTEGGEYVFRACFIDSLQGAVLAKFTLEELKVKKAAVLYDITNDYSKELAASFKVSFEKAAGSIAAFESYNTEDTDFSAQLIKIKSKNPDVLLLPDYSETAARIAKQARAIGMDATFLGGDGWDSSDIFSLAGSAVNGAYFSNHYSVEDTSTEAAAFRKNYEQRYNSVPNASAVLGYDAGKILFTAVEKAESTKGEKVIEALKNIDITAVSGRIQFDQQRNAIKEAAIIQIENGKQIFIKKVRP